MWISSPTWKHSTSPTPSPSFNNLCTPTSLEVRGQEGKFLPSNHVFDHSADQSPLISGPTTNTLLSFRKFEEFLEPSGDFFKKRKSKL
jgi:hypothetical protein